MKTWKVPRHRIQDLTDIIHSMYLSEAIASKVTPRALLAAATWTQADLLQRNAVIVQDVDPILFFVFLSIGEEKNVEKDSITAYIHRDVIELEKKTLTPTEQKKVITLTDIVNDSIRMVTAPLWVSGDLKRMIKLLKEYI